ncbi:MAG TPA: hypothetical protein VFA28_11275 [Bryobacteraceae bacterium]|nr:hypothetical protein [Bryobacteraceae bacterium]
MAGYLDTYGVQDAKREKRWKWILLTSAAAAVIGLALFLFFRNFREERAAKAFLEALRAHDYQGAYQRWGCTAQNPCRDYSFQKFMEDWGPNGQYKNVNAVQFTTVDACGQGVVLTVEYPNAEPFGLWVDRSTQTLGFAPWPRCPGRHWHLWDFIKSRFG